MLSMAGIAAGLSVSPNTVKTGLRIRVTMAQAQVGTCYAAGLSNTIKA